MPYLDHSLPYRDVLQASTKVRRPTPHFKGQIPQDGVKEVMLENWQEYMDDVGARVKVNVAWMLFGLKLPAAN